MPGFPVEVRVVRLERLYPVHAEGPEWTEMWAFRELVVAGLDGLFAVVEWPMRIGAPDGSFMAAAGDRDRWLGASRRFHAEAWAVDQALQVAVNRLWPRGVADRSTGGERRQRRYAATVNELRVRIEAAGEVFRRDTPDLAVPAAAAVERNRSGGSTGDRRGPGDVEGGSGSP